MPSNSLSVLLQIIMKGGKACPVALPHPITVICDLLPAVRCRTFFCNYFGWARLQWNTTFIHIVNGFWVTIEIILIINTLQLIKISSYNLLIESVHSDIRSCIPTPKTKGRVPLHEFVPPSIAHFEVWPTMILSFNTQKNHNFIVCVQMGCGVCWLCTA